jgi:RHH-type proline utilization regulon transcriptional repressor/proline dehydrogenase/delta 1-pyrroline-5-carboxylate dehydrogenase
VPLAGRQADREDHIRRCGERLLAAAAHHADTVRSGWLDVLVERALRDRAFRTQALRFVDVLPVLRDDTALVAHLQEYFSALPLPWPALSRWSLRHSDAPWALPVAAPLVRATLRGLARRFMGGGNLRQALQSVARLRAQGMDCSLDLLGEAVLSEHEADGYQQACLDLLAALRRHPDGTAAEISLKLSSLGTRILPADPDGSCAAIQARLRPLLAAARAQGTAVTIDMEQFELRHIVLRCFRELFMEAPLRDWPLAGIAVQAYARDAREQLQDLIEWAGARGTPVKIRLVRGAYWDTETVLARQHGWPSPVWEHKAQTDACYEDCLQRLFAQHDRVIPAVATHNVRSLACAMALAEDGGLARDAFEFQMLYGMADDLKQALVALGYPLRVYVPYGEILPGMAYLVRRLLENTSGQTILETGMGRVVRSAEALAPPEPVAPRPRAVAEGFRNTPIHRFTEREERAALRAALDAVQAETGREYALVINNEACPGSGFLTSRNPAHPAQVIGRVASAGRAQAEQALAAARAAFPDWRALPATERAGLLRRLAGLLAAQRDVFAAWQVLEAGKHWCEADADVCEAIDFLQYYAGEAERLAAGTVVEASGEHNTWQYRPRGVGLVLAPWNFPLAILTGMLAATIVTGNTAIVKPSSLTPVIAARFMELVRQAELPPGVVNFLPGPGAQTGAWLAAHPDVATIAFTGSRAVGMQLLQAASCPAPGQRGIKRVIAELGGKNAILVDADADLDAAVPGVLQSAFGYQGQKCSAASRVITVGRIHAPFVERLCAAVASLRIGDPADPGNLLGPVIDAGAQRRIAAVIEQGRGRARLLGTARTDLPGDGYYLAPAIFTEVAADDLLAQEEIFGPVLAVLHADSFDRALALANDTAYALTAGVYSRSPAHLALARNALQAGNLYFNRRITGALVGRQPFGGFRCSGTGSKAGGPDYLQQFLDPVCITENTLRRGFAPDAGEAP